MKIPDPDQSAPPTRAIGLPLQHDAQHRWAVLLLALVLAAAVGHRLFLVLTTDFPINDGGLFYAFILQIAQTFPSLPATVTYNHLELPFAYSPLSFWLAALFTKVGMDTLAIIHIAPIAMNLIYVFLFALILRRSGQPLIVVAIAMLFFCTMLRTFEWLVMGGGLSRGLGSLFLMATLLAIGIPDRGIRKSLPLWRVLAAGAAVAAAILSHMEWGLNAAACVILSRALGSISIKEFIRDNLIAGFTALLLISPWLLFVYDAHGLTPFLTAGGSGHWGFSPLFSGLRMLGIWSLFNPMIPVGLAVALIQRRYFWPIFLLIVIVLTPRHAPTPLTMPYAVFAALGALWFFGRLSELGRGRTAALAFVVLFMSIVIGGRLNSEYLARGNTVRPLGERQREAMQWVASNHRDASFIVLDESNWTYDSSAEWFPVLAGARSINTVQGREWVPGTYARFNGKDFKLKQALLLETANSCSELIGRLGAFEQPQFLWSETKQHCFPASRFRPVYRNEAVTIYELMPGTLGDPRLKGAGSPAALRR